MDGLSCLGADDTSTDSSTTDTTKTKKKGFDIASFVESAAPAVAVAATKALEAKDTKIDPKTGKPVDNTPTDATGKQAGDGKGSKKDEGSFLTSPMLGPIPGWGVLGLLASLGGGGWWYFNHKK